MLLEDRLLGISKIQHQRNKIFNPFLHKRITKYFKISKLRKNLLKEVKWKIKRVQSKQKKRWNLIIISIHKIRMGLTNPRSNQML